MARFTVWSTSSLRARLADRSCLSQRVNLAPEEDDGSTSAAQTIMAAGDFTPLRGLRSTLLPSNPFLAIFLLTLLRFIDIFTFDIPNFFPAIFLLTLLRFTDFFTFDIPNFFPAILLPDRLALFITEGRLLLERFPIGALLAARFLMDLEPTRFLLRDLLAARFLMNFPAENLEPPRFLLRDLLAERILWTGCLLPPRFLLRALLPERFLMEGRFALLARRGFLLIPIPGTDMAGAEIEATSDTSDMTLPTSHS